MADHSINKLYSEDLRVLEVTDPGHADTFNPLFKQLVNNDAFLKLALKSINENVSELTQKNFTRAFLLKNTGGISSKKTFGTSEPKACSKRLKFTRRVTV